MKKFFLLVTLLNVMLAVDAQMYVTEGDNLVKITKTVVLTKEGKYDTFILRDTIGQGDFDSIPIPSEYLKVLAETGSLDYQDTITIVPKSRSFFFPKEIYRRESFFEKDIDSYYFPANKKLTLISREWNPVVYFFTFLILILFAIFLSGGFSKTKVKEELV